MDSLGPPRKIPSHPPKYRRASVAVIIRIRPDHQRLRTALRQSTNPYPTDTSDEKALLQKQQKQRQRLGGDYTHLTATEDEQIDVIEQPESLEEFFGQTWVQTGTPEILFIERATRKTDRWSGHVALPGGKQELHEDDQETAARETLEEIGLDLADPRFFRCVGQLDDLYIQLTPTTPPLRPQPDEVASVHWQPLSLFLDRLEQPLWTPMVINLSSKLTPRLSRTFLRGLFGTMSLHSIEMPYKPEFVLRQRQEGSKTVVVVDHHPEWDPNHRPLKLWGLTLQMTADLLELKDGPINLDIRQKVWDSKRMRRRLDAGYLPSFSQADMHFWVRALLKFHSWQGTENMASRMAQSALRSRTLRTLVRPTIPISPITGRAWISQSARRTCQPIAVAQAVQRKAQWTPWMTAAVVTTGVLAWQLGSATIYAEASSETSHIIDPDSKLEIPRTIPAEDGSPARLLGFGVRKITFLQVQVYVVGLYAKVTDLDDHNSRFRTIPEIQKFQKDDHQSADDAYRAMVLAPVELVLRIAPVRNTNGPHLRDGFTRALTQSAKDQKLNSVDNEEAMDGIMEFKNLFPKGKINVGSALLFRKHADGIMTIEFDGETLGTIKNAWVIENFFMGYLQSKKPISPKARDSIGNGIHDLLLQ
ncbi:hypothetical protein BGZ73_001661 [Actinomortierella ambigua]|nr:hypothetical protein BGZ73_001661 [Actinomortierella ambigua]